MVLFFFFNDTATTEIYTLSLHDALPICPVFGRLARWQAQGDVLVLGKDDLAFRPEETEQLFREHYGLALTQRSEEHTSELQSRQYLVCRLLLEKKKKTYNEHKFTLRLII